MKNIEELKRKIENLKPLIKEKFKVKELGIFGSFARGEEREKSDLDLLVEFDKEADFFHLVGLSIFLEEKLNQKVDIVPKNALRKEIRKTVLRELIPL